MLIINELGMRQEFLPTHFRHPGVWAYRLPWASRKCSCRGGLKMHQFFHILHPSVFFPEATVPSMQSSSRRDRARVGGLSGLATQFPRVASANPASVPKRCSIRYIFKPPAWIHVRAVADIGGTLAIKELFADRSESDRLKE